MTAVSPSGKRRGREAARETTVRQESDAAGKRRGGKVRRGRKARREKQRCGSWSATPPSSAGRTSILAGRTMFEHLFAAAGAVSPPPLSHGGVLYEK